MTTETIHRLAFLAKAAFVIIVTLSLSWVIYRVTTFIGFEIAKATMGG